MGVGNIGMGGDAFFQQVIGGALGAAMGSNPGNSLLMPGPISHLTNRLQTRIGAAGMPGLVSVFPTPSFTSPLDILQGGIPPAFGGQGFTGFGSNVPFNFFGGVDMTGPGQTTSTNFAGSPFGSVNGVDMRALGANGFPSDVQIFPGSLNIQA